MSIEATGFPWTSRTPSPPVLYVHLHLPTGASGASEIWALPNGAPTAGHGYRLLQPDTPAPDESDRPWSVRTTDAVDRALAAHGWAAVPRREARCALSARFGLEREDGILQAVRGEETVWQFSEFAAVAFALPIPGTRETAQAGPGHGGQP
ncbi:hypothetical protein OG871_40440 (plasmid) [Kitasatospora sp. NBC_00374]|uniref:hypothetical protein n=1 Tax=Kitasatospora sp. NBC_00374 TaxID=2975964 RepID=UPI002F919065